MNDQISSNPNFHISEFLKYYINLTNPQYAVLLNGKWGIGKTFLIDSLVKELGLIQDKVSLEAKKYFFQNTPVKDKKNKKYIYISLYGLSSIDEIKSAILCAKYPILNNKYTKISIKAANGLARGSGFDSEMSGADFQSINQDVLYIFDDLERCELDSLNKILGYINTFVEHVGCNVIIIANEDEIKHDFYKNVREKVIGKTLVVRSATVQALIYFIQNLKHEGCIKFLSEKQNNIVSIYSQSKADNLRVLKQTICDFERIYSCLNETIIKNDNALDALLELFFALSIDYKLGRLQKNNFKERYSQSIMLHIEKSDKNEFHDSISRYSGLNISDSILKDDDLIDILVDGFISAEKINNSISQSKHFLDTSLPAWKKVWHSFDILNDEFESACAEMESYYAAYKYTKIGEILHVFGLRLLLSEMQVIKLTYDDVLKEGKEYIDYLANENILEPYPINDHESTFSSGGYEGLMIQNRDTDQYRMFHDYIIEMRKLARDEQLPELAEKLLQEMIEDSYLFYRRLCLTNSEDNKFYSVPILKNIDPKIFIETLISISPDKYHRIFSAIHKRYEFEQFNKLLISELPWLNKLRALLQEKLKEMSLLDNYRFGRFIEESLDTSIAKLEAINTVTTMSQ